MYQERYWKELYQLKVHLNYLELYLQQSEFIEKIIRIFLAVTSSGSIAGWAIWQSQAFVWGAIIATSQLITVINNFLPYSVRMKVLPGLIHEIEDLTINAERNWFQVSEGRLTEEEIHQLQFELRSKKAKAIKKHIENNTLPERPDLFSQAQTSADVYFNNFYPTEDN